LQPVRQSVRLFARLSVRDMPSIYSRSESRKNFKFGGDVT